MLSIYLIVCVHNFSFITITIIIFFRSIILLCLVLLLVEIYLLRSSYKHFIFSIIIILFVCAVSVIGHLAVGTAHYN
jgi:hypothetical protein